MSLFRPSNQLRATTSLSLRWRVMFLAMSMVAMVVVLAAAMGVSVLNKISVHNSFSEC